MFIKRCDTFGKKIRLKSFIYGRGLKTKSFPFEDEWMWCARARGGKNSHGEINLCGIMVFFSSIVLINVFKKKGYIRTDCMKIDVSCVLAEQGNNVGDIVSYILKKISTWKIPVEL